jgi:cellulose synthase/poly-beta-1,6-N-acetylglucosamine synthase-like glycosyltransferase
MTASLEMINRMIDESITRTRSDGDESCSPLLSVAMANYNHGHFIETALTALTSQSLPPDEIVVVDDGSTDDSLEKISRLAAEHSSIRLITNERIWRRCR